MFQVGQLPVGNETGQDKNENKRKFYRPGAKSPFLTHVFAVHIDKSDGKTGEAETGEEVLQGKMF